MNRQQMLDQDKLDTLNTAIIEAKNKYQQKKQHEIEEMRRRQGKLKELIRYKLFSRVVLLGVKH